MASPGGPPQQVIAPGLTEPLTIRRFSTAKKKFSMVEFTSAQRMLAEKVLGKWHNLVEQAHSELAKGMWLGRAAIFHRILYVVVHAVNIYHFLSTSEIPRKQDMMFQMRQIPKTGVIVCLRSYWSKISPAPYRLSFPPAWPFLSFSS